MSFVRHRFLTVLFLPGIFWTALFVSEPDAREILIDRIAAIVNSEPILLSEVEERLQMEHKKESGSILQLLNQIIDQKLEIQAAHKKGISVTDSEVQSSLEKSRAQNGLKDDEAFKKSLEKENLTLEKVTEELKNQILIQKLIQRDILQDVVVQEKDLKAYYQNHLDLFMIPEKREISQILFEWKPEDDPSVKDKIREEAKAIFRRLDQGESVESLMKEKWNYTRTLSLSELGTFGKGELLPVLDQAAFGTDPGKWSTPVESSLGTHLLRVNRKPSRYREFQEVSEVIRERVFQEKGEILIGEWMANLRKSATIEIPLLKDPAFNNQGVLP